MLRRVINIVSFNFEALVPLQSYRYFLPGQSSIPPLDSKPFVEVDHRPIVEEAHKARMREQQEYYAKYEPDKPAPLPENCYKENEFGMRRRWRVIKDDQLLDGQKQWSYYERICLDSKS